MAEGARVSERLQVEVVRADELVEDDEVWVYGVRGRVASVMIYPAVRHLRLDGGQNVEPTNDCPVLRVVRVPVQSARELREALADAADHLRIACLWTINNDRHNKLGLAAQRAQATLDGFEAP